MEFLAKTWGLWLVIAVVCYGYALFNQLRRMKRMMDSDFDDGFKGFLKGVASMILAGLAGTVSFILFVVGVIARLAQG